MLDTVKPCYINASKSISFLNKNIISSVKSTYCLTVTFTVRSYIIPRVELRLNDAESTAIEYILR